MAPTATEPAPPAQEKTSTKKTSTKKVQALLLTQGGAPLEWHVIHGVGYVHPEIPSPVGGEGEPSVAVAEKLADAEGCEVTLVKVTEAQAAKGREARDRARGKGLEVARELRKLGRRASTADVEQVNTEVAAAAGRE